MDEEIWKPILGYEGYYEISNTGRVKSLPRKGKGGHSGKILMPQVSSGYHKVCLCLNQQKLQKQIHRLVASAFIPNPLNKPEVNHINLNKFDNMLSNLEWVTSSENTIHAYNLGIIKKPTNKTKLKENDIHIIRDMIKNGISTREICKKYNVSFNTINYVKRGLSWAQI